MSTLARYGRNLFYPRNRVGSTFSMYMNRARRNARSGIMNAYRSRTGVLTSQRRGRGGQGITTQHDRSLIYRKRRMPRRRRRVWRRFNRKVNAVSEKDLGSRTVVRNSLVVATHPLDTTGANQHGKIVVALYPCQSGDSWMNDIREMSQDTDLGTTGKAIFKSGILDLTVRNSSERQTASLNPAITLEIDVYEISVNVDLGQTGKASTLIDVFNEGSTDTATIPGQTTALTSISRGWTPWDSPSALSEYKVKIWKKTKYFLSENQTFTYQYRDPKRHVIDQQRMLNPGENMRGVTRFLMFVYKPAPGYVYTDITPDVYELSVGITRKYLYKINDKTQDYDMYNT